MRNLLAFVGALLLMVLGLGWYLDWYNLSSGPAAEGKKNVNIEFDTIKIGEDLQKGGEKLQDILERARRDHAADRPAGVQEPAEPATPETPRIIIEGEGPLPDPDGWEQPHP